MATLRLRLTLFAAVLAALAASCASAPSVPADLPGVPNPYTTEYLRAEALGVEIHAFTQGPEDADILVLLVHGWGASGAEGLVLGHALQGEASAARDSVGPEPGGAPPTVRLVSPDLPGSGASGKPDAPYTPEWFADVLEAFRARLGRDRIVVAGHSLGGRLALEYAERYPERTEALILLAPAALRESFYSLDRWAMRRKGVVRAGSNLVSERSYLRFYRKRAVSDPKYVYPRIAQWALDGLLTPEGRKAFRVVTGSALASPDFSDRLGKVEVPVLLVWGREDEVMKFESSGKYRAEMPDLRGFLALEGCGHIPQTERAPETAAAVYEFLRSLRVEPPRD